MALFSVSTALWVCDGSRDELQSVGQSSLWMKAERSSLARLASPPCRELRKKFPGATASVGAAAADSSDAGPSVLGLKRDVKVKQESQLTSHEPEVVPSSYSLNLLGGDLGSPIGGDLTAPLLYEPYMDHLWSTLLNGTPDLHSLPLEPDFRRQDSKKGSKVFNYLFAASRLRRIRFTYFDGGSAVQAFNGLLYPDVRYDLPLLGIDLLAFGANKILCVIDFTPLIQDSAYLSKYTKQLGPIRAEIAQHCGRMTSKFYDETQFFSKELIFFRSTLGPREPLLKVPDGLLFKAYAGYIDNYLQILQAAEPNEDPLQMIHVSSRQTAYNEYSKERDPAIKLFNSHFGNEWSERFTHDFLFLEMTM